MKRFRPAIADFSTVFDLMRQDRGILDAATLARGIAWVQLEETENAKRDFALVLKLDPKNASTQVALSWLNDRSKPRPAMFSAPQQLIRPTKPHVVTEPLEIEKDSPEWKAEPPYNLWILRSAGRKEYGPVPKETLDIWASEGRFWKGMKVLRADWSKWKRVEKVYPEIDERIEQKNAFPGIEIRRTAATNGSIAEVRVVADLPAKGEIPGVNELPPVTDVEPGQTERS
jgi:hypothetical protein